MLNQMPPNMQQQQMMQMNFPQQQMGPQIMGQMQPPSYQSMFGNTPMMGNYQQQPSRPPTNVGQGQAPQSQPKKGMLIAGVGEFLDS